MIETYRGYVNTWECDDVGHMNVQFYVAKLGHGLGVLQTALGLGPRTAQAQGIALRPVSDHIRFLNEVRVSTTLTIRSGILEADEDGLSVYSELVDSTSGQISAGFTTRLACFDAQGQSPRPLPAPFLQNTETARAERPDHGAPRGLAHPIPIDGITLDTVRARGFFAIHHGVVQPEDCSVHGWMMPHRYTNRISDGAGHIWNTLGMDRISLTREGFGVALIESLQNYPKAVPAGTVLSIYSAVTSVSPRTAGFLHMLFDTETGDCLGTSQVVALLLDLKARRAGHFTPDQIGRLTAAQTAHGFVPPSL